MDDLIERVRELHKPQERRYIRSVAYECHGCDQGPYPEGPPDWPCATAEIVYTPDEIQVVEARKAAQDHRRPAGTA
jgi:hypothetical protein